MGHCEGGDGTDTFDAIAALTAWVERGEAPARLAASRLRDGKPDRTRPLCAYPNVGRWTGRGSSDDAATFICTAP
jgi:feruloyl esterase